jgi:hypothetical protein
MKFYVLAVSFIIFLFFSCGNEVKDQKLTTTDSLQVNSVVNDGKVKIFEPIQDEEIIVLEKNGITLTEIKSENKATISLNLTTTSFKEGVNELEFSINGIDDYSLAIIENNYSVTHYQKNKISKEFLYGNNVFLAFLSYPNGISVKTNSALVLKNVVIDDDNLFNMNQPHLFYYLPKEKTVDPILDFCLINTSITKNGNKVKVTINDTEFIISKWAAYQIRGLQKTDNIVRIQLIDNSGNYIEGPFNDSGERNFEVIKNNS